jgi:hypothetical protein
MAARNGALAGGLLIPWKELAGIFRERDYGDEGELGSKVAVPEGWVNFARRERPASLHNASPHFSSRFF